MEPDPSRGTVAALLMAAALAGCQGEPVQSPGCCYYQCDGGFLGDYSAWYWKAGGCQASASLICAREHPDDPGVTQSGGGGRTSSRRRNDACKQVLLVLGQDLS